jgi:WD40 repeat protein
MNSNLGRFAIGCSDGSIIIWDFVRGVVIQNLNHSIAPTDILFSHDGLSLFVSSSNNIIKQYHIDNATIIKEIKIGKKNITRLARNPVVDVLAIGGYVS